MTNIFSDELFCIIFDFLDNVSDLENLMLSCRRFLELVRNHNKLWRLRVSVTKDVRANLHRLSTSFLGSQSNLKEMINIFLAGQSPVCDFVEEELLKNVFHPKMNSNFPLQYFAKEVLRHFRMHKIVREWKQEKSLLHGVVLLSQWFNVGQKHVTDFREIDHILREIVHHVKQQQLNEEKKMEPADAKTDLSTQTEAEKMFAIINQVLFEKMRLFSHERRSVYSFTIFDIIEVLRGHSQGRVCSPFILAIIYYEVAKRIGIPCELIYSFRKFRKFCKNRTDPHSLLLRWREFSNKENEAHKTQKFIDPFTGAAVQPLNSFRSYTEVSYKLFLKGVLYDCWISVQKSNAHEDLRQLVYAINSK